MSGWAKLKLDELGTLQRGRSRHRPRYAFHLYGGKYPFVQTSEIRVSRKYIREYEQTYSEAGLAQSKLWPKNTLCITIAANIAELAILSFDACFPDSVLGFIPDKDKADLDFIYYTLTHFQRELKHIGEGSVQDNINLGTFQDVLFPAPALPEQKAIAAVLSSLDDKIDLLHRQNQTLEAMAATLFRQWFVEEAQEDWDVVKLADVCTVITKGTTPTTLGHQFVEVGINFVKAESITDSGDFIPEKFAQISEETHQFLKRSIIESGDVLCSIAGTIGRIAIVDDSILPANTNQALAILRVDRGKCPPEFVYLFLKSVAFREIMDGKIVHAVQPNLSLGEIGSTTFQFPSQYVLREFEKTIRPIFEKKKHNAYQIRTLEALRDTLLPKLMSGEVRVTA